MSPSSNWRHRLTPSPTNKTISGFYQNCRGLRTKLVNFKCNVACITFDFLMLTETWLNSSFSDNKLGLVNYNIYRYDDVLILVIV